MGDHYFAPVLLMSHKCSSLRHKSGAGKAMAFRCTNLADINVFSELLTRREGKWGTVRGCEIKL